MCGVGVRAVMTGGCVRADLTGVGLLISLHTDVTSGVGLRAVLTSGTGVVTVVWTVFSSLSHGGGVVCLLLCFFTVDNHCEVNFEPKAKPHPQTIPMLL